MYISRKLKEQSISEYLLYMWQVEDLIRANGCGVDRLGQTVVAAYNLPEEQRAELTEWYKRSGLPLKRFFNTSGLLYKSLELKSKLPEMSEDEMLALLSTDGMLVKRPLLICEDAVLVGFKESEWTEKLKK